MPRGFKGVREASKDIQARREAGGGMAQNWFRLAGGEQAVVRFLEQGDDIYWCWSHELEPEEGRSWGRLVPCINQDDDGTACPGCEHGLKRRFQGYINLIWRDGPIYKKDDDGKLERDSDNNLIIESRGDVLAVWRGGIQLFEELDGVDAGYKGLTSRDFRVFRRGEKLATKYQILPADPEKGAIELSKEDKALIEDKPDLSPLTKAPEYDKWGKSQADQTIAKVHDVNPFMAAKSDG